MKNIFWAVYDKKGSIKALSVDKRTAQYGALDLSTYRWTRDTFKKDWSYLVLDGYTIKKSEIKPIK